MADFGILSKVRKWRSPAGTRPLRRRFGVAPLVSPNYPKARSEMAKAHGLGVKAKSAGSIGGLQCPTSV
jgi:hypothetical protein